MTPVEHLDLVVIGAGTGANGVARACATEGWQAGFKKLGIETRLDGLGP